MKSLFFGNSLVSIPFFDMGGILTDNKSIEKRLIEHSIYLALKLNAKTIELRQSGSSTTIHSDLINTKDTFSNEVYTHKTRMLLELPDTSEALMKSFKSKLRSQIKKPIKEGLKAKIGSIELLNDFYTVFTINMRDLGSPVHSKSLIYETLTAFPDKARVVVVYHNRIPIAASIIIGFKNTIENPWASALRQFSRLAPNMLLYWKMLEYSCDNGYDYFDFGRSTPNEGTYRFKKQWGSEPIPLNWNEIYLTKDNYSAIDSDKSRFKDAIKVWQRLPVPISRVFGPMIRKYISL
jgi:FemAB-related protein (PEP-CTERM system-associated)